MREINLLAWREQARVRLRGRIRVGLAATGFLILCIMIFIYCRHAQSPPIAQHANTASIAAEKTAQIDLQLRQLKFAGYLHQDNRSWGLIILPNGKMRDVRVGSVLDIGHARVLSVSDSQIVLQLENHRKFVLH